MVYVDSSALLKLVVDEPESGALRLAAEQWSEPVSSLVADIELFRAVGRASVAGGKRVGARQRRRLRQQTAAVLSRIILLALDERIVGLAESIEPFSLRSLDAIHLATALSVRPIESFVAYDHRLSEAARSHGLSVMAPGW